MPILVAWATGKSTTAQRTPLQSSARQSDARWPHCERRSRHLFSRWRPADRGGAACRRLRLELLFQTLFQQNRRFSAQRPIDSFASSTNTIMVEANGHGTMPLPEDLEGPEHTHCKICTSTHSVAIWGVSPGVASRVPSGVANSRPNGGVSDFRRLGGLALPRGTCTPRVVRYNGRLNVDCGHADATRENGV